MDAFQAPEGEADEIDYAAAKPGVLVTLSGVAQVVAGATTSTTGLQLWVFVYFFDWMFVLPYILMPIGLVQMALGAVASRGRDWASIAVTMLTWMLQLLALFWAWYSLSNGFFSLLTVVWVLLNGLAGLLAPAGIPGALAASRARRALYR